MQIEKIQKKLLELGIDGWLFYDFHNRDKIGLKILGLSIQGLTTRRWFYFIPAEGKPIKLVHRVEPDKLDSLPGEKFYYSGWRELHDRLKEILGTPKKIAMQYSPMNSIPYISIVDAGTVELVRSLGHEVVSSADLIQIFEALIDENLIKTHFEAGRLVDETLDEAFDEIRKSIKTGKYKTEYEIQQFILKRFNDKGLTSDEDPPIVGVNDHPANPHFYPTPENTREIKPGDKLLIDLWAKKNEPGAIFYDITWCAFIGDNPPEDYVKIFNIVRAARNEALKFIQDRLDRNQEVAGWEVDDVARKYIQEKGYAEFFTHRTGHSIGENVHGNGVNIDNFETQDLRKLMPGCLFSLEPGIYIPGKMGVRSEVNVYINFERKALITGREQKELVLIY